ncbi:MULTISPECIES: hypothetical protein [unclassified Sphingobacterium]|nr:MULTISPECIES: hypothetical protein [unclassified Sphingobacterium]KKX49159.1 hypothetical protein L950_0217225 [Sphingobacterium sp. IITKGP-BTPF85]
MKRDESLIMEIKKLPQEVGQPFAEIKRYLAFLGDEKKSDIIWL